MAQYIDKSALVAEIERRATFFIEESKKKTTSDDSSCAVALYGLLSFLDTLEVKEVDLEEEITSQIRLLNGVHTLDNGKQWWKGTYNELSYFAKHFFELGLKAQKGE